MTSKKIRKEFRLNQITLEKFNDLINAKRIENQSKKIGSPTETEVIEDAIRFYHSHVFGDQVLSQSVERFEMSLANILKMTMNSYMEQIAKSMNVLLLNTDASNDMIAQLLITTNIFGTSDTVHDIIQNFKSSDDLVDSIIEAEVIRKRGE